jgi:predicted transcriptional regulator
MADDLLGLTAQIVSAHVQRNAVAVEDLPNLIQEVHKTLIGLGEAPQMPTPQPLAGTGVPVVPITKSVFPDHIICLSCGKHMTMLKRHAMTEHQLTVDQYRAKFGLPPNYPMVAPNYAETRSQLAKDMGLGKNRAGAGRKAGRKGRK